MTLVLNLNRPVPLDRLTAALWDGEVPRSSISNLRSYAKELRQALSGADAVQLVGGGGAYQLTAAPEQIDLMCFERAVRDGRMSLARADYAAAVTHLSRAQSLWHGPSVSSLSCGRLLTARLDALNEQRLSAVEDLAEARLGIGRSAESVTDIRVLVAEEPLRERAWGLLMRTLYMAGDAAGALAAYAEAREHLADGLGIDPGTELRSIHQAVLRRDPRLTRYPMQAGPWAGAVGAFCSPVPKQLPRPALFVGRSHETGALCAALRGGDDDFARIVAVGGNPGTGKSALALHAAHAVRAEFPDGQLYADLAGVAAPDGASGADQVIGWFLRALGDPGAESPMRLGEATTRFRSITADLRLLVVLDNASAATQVRPLLPAGRACAVLVTSRRALDLDHAWQFTVRGLPEADAVALLERLVDARRPAATPGAAAQIARHCAYVPRALRAAARWLSDRPGCPLDQLADLLADNGGEPEAARALRALASLSAPESALPPLENIPGLQET
ncbi:AfsR/SARP family transcriptional regulator [Streptomyces sp. ISL-10]|uniref:AfsR/SARP family transcriptional regulator n=1 Tax=Streptomyces sp. ISL-10 TaxID=2819172 RepID=UPI001BE9E93D|nr:AfsR/SARP family transcriptional regulator [Streptomyces sp. ISL-10]MBT2369923.1 AfsR/SARP family transcriptional regulator [Streptomyces sp. ISL-10]